MTEANVLHHDQIKVSKHSQISLPQKVWPFITTTTSLKKELLTYNFEYDQQQDVKLPNNNGGPISTTNLYCCL